MMYVIILLIILFSSTLGTMTGFSGSEFLFHALDAPKIITNSDVIMIIVTLVTIFSTATFIGSNILFKTSFKKSTSVILCCSAFVGAFLSSFVYQYLDYILSKPYQVFISSGIYMYFFVFLLIMFLISRIKKKQFYIKHTIPIIILGFVLGFTCVFNGHLGSSLIILAVMVFVSNDIKEAVMPSIMVISLSFLALFIFSLLKGKIQNTVDMDWYIMIPFATFAIFGAFLGAFLYKKIPTRGIFIVYVILQLVTVAITINNIVIEASTLL